MFQKLVSNLSFSPSVVSQLTFYARRLSKENLTRRLSVVMGIGVVAFQIAATIIPPVNSNAASGNDIIFGGFSNKAELLQKYDGPSGDGDLSAITASQLRQLLAYFKIDRNSIVGATDATVRGSDRSAYSLGRNPHSADVQTITLTSIFGTQVTYLRPLSYWGTGAVYSVLRGTTTDGQPFALMKHCGNVVVWRLPPPPPPQLTVTKAMRAGYPAPGSVVHPGDTLGYRLTFHNSGSGQAVAALIEDAIPAYTTATWQGGGTDRNSHGVDNSTYLNHVNTPHYWWLDNVIAPGGGGYTDMNVVVNRNAPDGAQICNQADIRSYTTGPVLSARICHTVRVVPPPPPGVVSCTRLTATPVTGTAPLTVNFNTVAAATGTARIASYNYDLLGTGSTINSTVANLLYTYNNAGTYHVTVVVSDGHTTTPVSAACSLIVTVRAQPGSPELTFDKTAFNLTKLTDGEPTPANGTTAQPGDKIRYDLSAKNTGGSAEHAFVFSENLTDILEYADIVDAGGATARTTNGQHWLDWPAADIAAGANVSHSFTVQIKNPIPLTPQGLSDPNSFDLKLDNVFHGIPVEIKVPTPPEKLIESTNLPQTGAGANIAITFAFVAFSTYFYLRNRQLVTEIKTLSSNYHPGAN